MDLGVAEMHPDNQVAARAADSMVNWPSIGAEEFENLQFDQFCHDENFHREISRLTVKERLTHMTLHFAKYSGYLANDPDDLRLRRTITDLFVIGLSTLNGLNVRAHPLVTEIGQIEDTSRSALARRVAILAGEMASACERLDHLEEFPYRQTLQGAAATMVALALSAAEARQWSMPLLVKERLQRVKEKSIFYGRL
ncbi:hypothetical protein [Novosphingobium kaempferiae]|uniref:hypothetical protein n=1 Tax=Novosphingobium kaempferiae TaxID=2896849 RepID=UPI001E5DA73C|nr:hypothetical protein [Novosphingobium kaempferiae]